MFGGQPTTKFAQVCHQEFRTIGLIANVTATGSCICGDSLSPCLCRPVNRMFLDFRRALCQRSCKYCNRKAFPLNS